MELINEMNRYIKDKDMNPALLGHCLKKLVLVLSPFTPHICEEMWEALGGEKSVYDESWPETDESALVQDTVEVVLQINGKVKDKIDVAVDINKEEFEKLALENEKIKELTDGKNIVKVIAVPGKLVNIVVK